MTISEDSIFVKKQTGSKAIRSKPPYPGLRLIYCSITPLLLTAAGRGRIVDTIYEKRVSHVPEVAKNGGHHFDLERPHYLWRAKSIDRISVKATDSRAGAAGDRRSRQLEQQKF